MAPTNSPSITKVQQQIKVLLSNRAYLPSPRNAFLGLTFWSECCCFSFGSSSMLLSLSLQKRATFNLNLIILLVLLCPPTTAVRISCLCCCALRFFYPSSIAKAPITSCHILQYMLRQIPWMSGSLFSSFDPRSFQSFSLQCLLCCLEQC